MAKLIVSTTMDNLSLNVIGEVQSPYKEKFAIPRQPGLVNSAKGKILLTGEANNSELVRDLAQYSHIWVIFVFHQTQEQGWKSLVKAPRLGGNKKMGVLATRSTFRPNPIGMSVVKLDNVDTTSEQVAINISALDLLDGTPVLDIKPYIPYADAINDAHAGIAQEKPNTCNVVFSNKAQSMLQQYKNQYQSLSDFIEEVLAQDPRPAYKKNKPDAKTYGVHLEEFNVVWRMNGLNDIEVIDIVQAKI